MLLECDTLCFNDHTLGLYAIKFIDIRPQLPEPVFILSELNTAICSRWCESQLVENFTIGSNISKYIEELHNGNQN